MFEKALQKEMDRFSKRQVIEQVSYVNLTLTLLMFYVLRESIIATVKPETQFLANINFIHFGNIFERTRNMILDNVEKQGVKYATECLLTINKLMLLYANGRQEYKEFKKFEFPTIHLTEETNELLDKIHSHLNKNKTPEEHTIRCDVVDTALRDYAKKMKLN